MERRWRKGRKGEGERRGTKLKTPPPAEELTDRRRATIPEMLGRRRRQKRTRRGKRRKDTETERPHRGHLSRLLTWGRTGPYQRKTRTSWDSA